MKATRTLAERLEARLVPGPNGCLEFTGYRMPRGYGRIGLGRQVDGTDLTHRVAWRLAHGEIPEGMYVCHHCDNPPCCNPDHLFLGTNSENLLDLSHKGLFPQQQRTHCPRNHPYDEANTYVCPKGKRICRACRNDSARRRWHDKRAKQ